MAITLTVGTNTYVTATEADTFIQTYFLDDDEVALQWFDHSEEEKELFLLRSMKEIERMKFTGQRSNSTQTLEFPRNGSTIVPDEVKEAQIVNALVMSNSTANSLDNNYSDPASRGVKKYVIDDFSEEFFSAGNGFTSTKLSSQLATTLLSKWTIGGFRIR